MEPGEKHAIDNFLNSRLKTESVPLIRLPETTRNVYKHKKVKPNDLQKSSSSFLNEYKDQSTKDQTNLKLPNATISSSYDKSHLNNLNNLNNNDNNNSNMSNDIVHT